MIFRRLIVLIEEADINVLARSEHQVTMLLIETAVAIISLIMIMSEIFIECIPLDEGGIATNAICCS